MTNPADKPATLAAEAEAFRTMPNSDYADALNGRATVAEVIARNLAPTLPEPEAIHGNNGHALTLTANPSDRSVLVSAIAPDGSHVSVRVDAEALADAATRAEYVATRPERTEAAR